MSYFVDLKFEIQLNFWQPLIFKQLISQLAKLNAYFRDVTSLTKT